MKQLRRLSLALALLLILGSCLACGGKNTDKDPVPMETLEALGPQDPEQLTDYTADAEKSAYVEALRASFSDLAETSPEAFEKSETADGWRITEYLGEAGEVRVPALIDGKPVVELANGAFVANDRLTKLYLPDSITSIGTNVLSDCTSLTALRTPLLGRSAGSTQYLGYLFGASEHADNPLKVPTSLKYLELGGVGDRLAAFALFECNDLEVVTLPETLVRLADYSMYACERLIALNTEHLTRLDEHALDSCRALTRLSFASATTLEIGVLEGCVGLRTLEVPFLGDGGENAYLSYLFGAADPAFSKGYYPQHLARVTLLGGTALANYAFFECESLTEVKLPESIASIGTRAFSGCLYLSRINFPDAIARIGENAFFGCRSLVEIAFGEGSALCAVGVNAFYYCDALERVTLPPSLKSLPASCFAGCRRLSTINLDAIESIGENAFRGCESLPAEQ